MYYRVSNQPFSLTRVDSLHSFWIIQEAFSGLFMEKQPPGICIDVFNYKALMLFFSHARVSETNSDNFKYIFVPNDFLVYP